MCEFAVEQSSVLRAVLACVCIDNRFESAMLLCPR